MPNYAINTVYQPFSFQERMAPLQMMKEEYDNLGLTLSQLGEEANAWGQYIDPESRAGKTIELYNNTLREVADDLTKNGLKAVSRNTLFGLRRMYNNDVSKINKAAQSLASMYDTYRQAGMKDPSLMMGRMPTVDDLLDNPSAQPVAVSGEGLYAHSMQAAKAASDRIAPTVKATLGDVMRGYYTVLQQTGYDQNAANAFLADQASRPELQGIMDNVRQMFQTDQLSDPGRADSFILRGILDGMSGKTSYDFKFDQIGAEDRAAARAAAKSGTQSSDMTFSSGVPLHITNLYNQRKRSKDANAFEKVAGKYFEKLPQGGYRLSDKGKKAYERLLYDSEKVDVGDGVLVPRSSIPYANTYGMYLDLANVLSKAGIDDFENLAQQDLEAAFNAYGQNIQGELYDATKATGYQYDINNADKAAWMNQLVQMQDHKGRINTVEWDERNKTFNNGKAVDVSDIEGVLGFTASPYGSYMTVVGKDNKTYNLSIDRLNNPSAKAAINESMSNIAGYEANIHDFVTLLGFPEGTTVDQATQFLYAKTLDPLASESERVKCEAALRELSIRQEGYKAEQSGLMTNIAQIANTNKTKPHEYEGYDF